MSSAEMNLDGGAARHITLAEVHVTFSGFAAVAHACGVGETRMISLHK